MESLSSKSLAPTALGFLVALIGAVVMDGWVNHSVLLMQVRPDWTPMQFNTALMFVCAGLMVASLGRRWLTLCTFFSAVLTVFPFLTILQYLFEIDLHIDQLFIRSDVYVGTAILGRMAPNTALCFIFCGFNGFMFSLPWFRRTGHFIAGALIVFVFVLSFISLASYPFKFDPSYGWGNYSRMAVHTASCFLIISVALFILLLRLTAFSFKDQTSTLPVLSGSFLLLLTFIAWQMTIHTERKHIVAEMDARASSFKEKSFIFLDERLKTLSRMAVQAAATNGMSERMWRLDSKLYLRDMSGLLAVGYTDADSSIRWSEPFNKTAVGIKLDREPVRAGAIQHAALTGETTVTHAINLISGKFGFIAVAPIRFDSGELGGFVFMATDFKTFFRSLIDPHALYDFQVYQISSKEPVLLFDDTLPQSMQSWKSDIDMHWKGVDWRISVVPRPELLRSLTSVVPIATLLIGLILAIFTSILVHLYLISVEAQKQAEAATEAKARFLANMSHEIRTPLNGVVGLSHLLNKTKLDSQQQDFLNGIVSSAEALLALISDILDLSKVEAGKVRLETIDFSLQQVVGDCMSLLTNTAGQKSLRLSCHIDPTAPPWLKGDPFRLRQILLNLLSNAIKFTDTGSVTLTVGLESRSDDGCTLRFDVTDTGAGLAPESAARLFNAFEQANSSTTRTHGGTGLGLSICKMLIEAMGGTISVESAVGQGSTFWFRLPYANGTEHLPQKTTPVADLGLSENCRILIVEDNPINQKIALAYLGHLNCRAHVAANGKEALEAVRSNTYDLVLMDVHMPEMDGFEATYQIRHDTKEEIRNIRIIAMTANALEGDRERCLEAGMNDYISKPIDPRELALLLAKWLPSQEKTVT